MFHTVSLSIIRSFSLYTQQWYMSYRFAVVAVCTVKNSWWWTEEKSETSRVLFQKLEKLVHLVGSIIRIYHDARSPERQTEIFVMRQHSTCWNDSHSCHWHLVVLPPCHYQVIPRYNDADYDTSVRLDQTANSHAYVSFQLIFFKGSTNIEPRGSCFYNFRSKCSHLTCSMKASHPEETGEDSLCLLESEDSLLCCHSSMSLVPLLRQTKPFRAFPSYCFKSILTLFIPSDRRSLSVPSHLTALSLF